MLKQGCILLVALLVAVGCGDSHEPKRSEPPAQEPTLVERYVRAKDETEVAQLLAIMQARLPEVLSEIMGEVKKSDETFWRLGKVMNLARMLGRPGLDRLAPELDRVRVQTEDLSQIASALQDELGAPKFAPSTGETWEQWWQRNKLKEPK